MSDVPSPRGFTTAILHGDRGAPIEHGALHKPLHLSVAYGYRRRARPCRGVPGPRSPASSTAGRATRRRRRSKPRSTRWRRGSRPSASRPAWPRSARVMHRAAEGGRSRRREPVPVRQHEQPVPDAGVARHAGDVRRRDRRRGRRARACAPRRGWYSSRRSRIRARRSPTSSGSASSARRADIALLRRQHDDLAVAVQAEGRSGRAS